MDYCNSFSFFNLAKELGLEWVLIVGDSLQTIQAIEQEEVNGAVGHIVARIVQEMRSFADVKVKHIGRTGNEIAHELAQQAKKVRMPCAS